MAKAELIKARELIANGWVQGRLELHGCYCLDGAVLKANSPDKPLNYVTLRYNSPESLSDLRHLAQFFPKRYGVDPVEWAYSFNDADDRTQEEVLAVLDKAIENYPD